MLFVLPQRRVAHVGPSCVVGNAALGWAGRQHAVVEALIGTRPVVRHEDHECVVEFVPLLEGVEQSADLRVGVIEEGAYADILLIDGNPIEKLELPKPW